MALNGEFRGTNLWQTLEISLRILRVTEQRRPAQGGGEHKRESSCRRTGRGHYAKQKHGGSQRKGCEFARDTRGKNSARAPNPTAAASNSSQSEAKQRGSLPLPERRAGERGHPGRATGTLPSSGPASVASLELFGSRTTSGGPVHTPAARRQREDDEQTCA
ncbi:hypothetical protein HPB47_006534 [Ixodes persulcatus]|uniref:Uncharacterized protein n=1 Tax=Ixodes persulcatus TaxID=34615 RepID=A0AC60PA43_IXOPE|nr:hypothetical protein HPB47_006534 [Ixodes persulcatus]